MNIHPSKAERVAWTKADELNSVHREALMENAKREWVKEAAKNHLCPACGEWPAGRCRRAGSCGPAILALHARQRKREREQS
jgi:hypothetical protein